jgi:hypothetical protein
MLFLFSDVGGRGKRQLAASARNPIPLAPMATAGSF